jgi:hypothetical protein
MLRFDTASVTVPIAITPRDTTVWPKPYVIHYFELDRFAFLRVPG